MKRSEWLKERETGLGASDSPIIMGLSKFKTNEQLWLEKTGRVKAEDISDKPYVKFGNDAEEPLRQLFMLEHPEYTLTHSEYALTRSKERPHMFATPDGILTHRSTGDVGGLEIKTTEIRRAADWLDWLDKIPDMYYIQVLHQMYVLDWSFVHVWAYIRHYGKEGEMQITLRDYKIERAGREEDIEQVTDACDAFWQRVQDDRKPNLKLPII